MKILLSLLLFSPSSFACLNSISKIDAQKVIEAKSYQVAETLTSSETDALCADGINLLDSDLIDGVLTPNPDKKFARELAEKIALDTAKTDAEKKKSAKDILKAFKCSGNTVAASIKCQNDLAAALYDILK